MFILDWISDNGSPVDLAVFIMGMGVLFLVIEQRREIRQLRKKYNLLDKLILYHAAILLMKLGVRTVKQHRSGDIEIVEPLNKDE